MLLGHLGRVGLSPAQIFALQQASLTRIKAAVTAATGNNPVDNAEIASPTITQSATPTLTALANPLDNPAVFRTSLGNKYVKTTTKGLYIGGSTWRKTDGTSSATNLSTVTNLSPTFILGDEDNCKTVEFKILNSRFVEFNLSNPSANTPYRVALNKQFAPRAGFTRTAQYVKFDLGSVQASISILLDLQTASQSLQGVLADAGATIAIEDYPTFKMLSGGDSITEGSSSGDTVFHVNDRWSSVTAKQLGATLRQGGVGGTGWSTPATRAKFVDQLRNLAATGEQYDLIEVMNGYNDQAVLDATFQADVLSALILMRSLWPGAIIVAGGVFAEATGPNAAVINKENKMLATFQAWNDPASFFVKNCTDAGGSWFQGTDYIGHIVTGTGNTGTLISSDGIHQAQAGGLFAGGKNTTAVLAALPALYTAFGVP